MRLATGVGPPPLAATSRMQAAMSLMRLVSSRLVGGGRGCGDGRAGAGAGAPSAAIESNIGAKRAKRAACFSLSSCRGQVPQARATMLTRESEWRRAWPW
jgi:hypothetical protein